MTGDYRHPDGGRIYRESDPAHHFATLAKVLANEARHYIDEYDRRLAGHDYLRQFHTWSSDPNYVARSMVSTIAALDEAYTAVIVDRDMPSYGFGKRDEEWRRKYDDVIDGE